MFIQGEIVVIPAHGRIMAQDFLLELGFFNVLLTC
jgi:hypothetical protein